MDSFLSRQALRSLDNGISGYCHVQRRDLWQRILLAQVAKPSVSARTLMIFVITNFLKCDHNSETVNIAADARKLIGTVEMRLGHSMVYLRAWQRPIFGHWWSPATRLLYRKTGERVCTGGYYAPARCTPSHYFSAIIDAFCTASTRHLTALTELSNSSARSLFIEISDNTLYAAGHRSRWGRRQLEPSRNL